jgi:hypothetical protein
MNIGNMQVGVPANKTATGNVKPVDGAMLGFFCNSTSSGTVQFYDSSTTTTTTSITGVITPTAGVWYALPFTFTNGLYAVIANTLNITISVI